MGGVAHSIEHYTNDSFNFIKDNATGHFDKAFKDLGNVIVDGLTLSGVKQFFGLLGIKDYDKWIENAQFVNLLNTNKLYQKTLLSMIKDPTNIKSLQNSIINLQNNKCLLTAYNRYEKFGFNVKPTSIIYYTDKESIALYYTSVLNYTNVTINNYNNEEVVIYKQKDFIKSNYYIKDIFIQTLKNQTSLGEYSTTIGSIKINGKYATPILYDDGNGNITIEEEYDSDNNITYLKLNNIQLNEIDSFTGDGTTTTFNLKDYSIIIDSVTIGGNTVDSSNYTLINSFTTGSQIKFNTAPDKNADIEVTYDYLDNNNSDLIKIEYPIDTRVLLVVDISSDQLNSIDVLLNSDIQTNIDYISFLIIPIKNNGEPTGDTKYRKVIFNNYGIKVDNFNELINNTDIKDTFLTYSAKRSDSNLTDLFDYIYGTSNKVKIVKINTDQYNIEYDWFTVTDSNNSDSNSNTHNVNICKYNGEVVDNLTNAFMIPTIYLQYLGTKEFYDFMSKYLNLAIYSAVKHHIHWYQTESFNILLQLGSFAIAISTGNVEAFAIATALTIATNLLPKQYRIYAKILIAVTTGSYSGSANEIAIEIALMIPKIVTEFYMIETNRIENKINKYEASDKKTEEEIRKLNEKKYMYNPFDKFEDYDFLVYDYAYNPLDALEANNSLDTLCKLGG